VKATIVLGTDSSIGTLYLMREQQQQQQQQRQQQH
jgi:hypothetical protein